MLNYKVSSIFFIFKHNFKYYSLTFYIKSYIIMYKKILNYDLIVDSSRLTYAVNDRLMTYHILREELMRAEDEVKGRELNLAWQRISKVVKLLTLHQIHPASLNPCAFDVRNFYLCQKYLLLILCSCLEDEDVDFVGVLTWAFC